MKQKLATDAPYMNNHDLPIWIVPISGWGSDAMEEAYTRMEIYKNVAKELNINIEFSSRLGTFQSYKRAPAVAAQIEEHNEKTFAVYEENLGKDWRQKFSEEVQKQLKK
ncbi:hypothetical protein [Cytophaga aurantiaca]|uniref:hypothetical protein n=1 Tax=Cytophaga aurantiaca TaxID=29530 RepID=UPI00036CC039|nr:hypothetical protein [Cytophaga aurantiaca]